jgi:hypothetical protein
MMEKLDSCELPVLARKNNAVYHENVPTCMPRWQDRGVMKKTFGEYQELSVI